MKNYALNNEKLPLRMLSKDKFYKLLKLFYVLRFSQKSLQKTIQAVKI